MAEKLKDYNQKRNFGKTDEPKGKTVKTNAKLHYVVQHHMASREHFDFRLEWKGVLLSWAVPKGPSLRPADKRLAIQVEDHPLDYRHFEGTIPKGEYGGGTVMLWDEGFWEPLSDAAKGLNDSSLTFALHGKRLQGKWKLVQTAFGGEKENQWLLMKEKDEFAKDSAGISDWNTSIESGRTMDEIAIGIKKKKETKNPFDFAEPQLVQLVSALPQGNNWLYELKYDGYRILSYVEAGKARLISRNQNDLTKSYPSIAESLVHAANGRSMVIDGEMVAVDENGKTDFQTLQNFKSSSGKKLSYVVFDLLALNGTDLRDKPLTERKKQLRQIMKNALSNLHFSEHRTKLAKENVEAVCRGQFEGIVAKKADSPYTGTRNGDWVKLKCNNRQEFVLGGYTVTDKKTNGISAVLLGYYEGETFLFAGRAGTGFTREEGLKLEEQFKKIKTSVCPFERTPKNNANETVIWLKPKLAAEIQFAEWTKDGVLRNASFKALRSDKESTTIVKETAKAEGKEKVKLTSPQKVVFNHPKLTKEDVAQYYQTVWARMKPFVQGRLLTLIRCPSGVSTACFYKKHPDEYGTELTVPITNSEGKKEEYVYANDLSGLLYQVQMNSLEFHIWGSKAENPDKPDLMVFDLDPDEKLALDAVRQGARHLKTVLEELSLVSFLKTSGGKGYHIVVPFQPANNWETFRTFSKKVAEVMEQKWPNLYTTNIRKNNRKGKIFIDWLRNTKGATSVAPYSLRAREGAPVSMPIDWSELDQITPNGINIHAAIQRLDKSDPWKDYSKVQKKQKLN